MEASAPLVFALEPGAAFGDGVAAALGTTRAPHEERAFEDGEHKLRPLTGVAGGDVFVVHSLHGGGGQSANDRLCRLLFFVATLRDHRAARVTVVCPYLAYGRKDRRTKWHDPVTTRYIAQLFEAVGTDRVAVLEPHNPAAFENAFRIPALALHARRPLLDALLAGDCEPPFAVVSPDTGGAKRAAAFREALAARTGHEPGTAFLDKQRSEGRVTGDTVAGDVRGRTAIVIDDLIAGGTTALRAAHACRERGASAVHVVVTHGLFADGAERLFADAPIDRLLLTDSVGARMQDRWGRGVESVSVQPLMADVIDALHRDASVSAALGG